MSASDFMVKLVTFVNNELRQRQTDGGNSKSVPNRGKTGR
jgi:hypothetical protein